MTSALLLLPLLFALPFARRVATLLSTLTAESATKYEAEAAARQSNLDALAQRTAKDMKEQGPVPPGKYGNRRFPSNRLEKRAGQWLVRNGAFLQATCRVSRTTVSRCTPSNNCFSWSLTLHRSSAQHSPRLDPIKSVALPPPSRSLRRSSPSTTSPTHTPTLVGRSTSGDDRTGSRRDRAPWVRRVSTWICSMQYLLGSCRRSISRLSTRSLRELVLRTFDAHPPPFGPRLRQKKRLEASNPFSRALTHALAVCAERRFRILSGRVRWSRASSTGAV